MMKQQACIICVQDTTTQQLEDSLAKTQLKMAITGMCMEKIMWVIKYFKYHKQGLVKVKYLYNNNILLNLFI